MSNSKSRSAIAGAVIETNASKSASGKCADIGFSIYRIPTRRSPTAVESVLAKEGFVTSNAFNGGFVPRVVTAVEEEDILALFECLARPDLVGRSSMNVPDGKIGTVEATKAFPYKRSIETVTHRNGSKKVTSEVDYINTGLGLCFEPTIVADGTVDLVVRRRLSHFIPGAGELQRIANRVFSVRAKLARDQALVHAEFVADRMPTSRCSGEVVVTLIRAREAQAA
ncbi:hypothetical protein O9X98_08505 [Agrobacterium salinitolerans]|nr:hypothetical protein [Agrobacterium salinitolerans]